MGIGYPSDEPYIKRVLERHEHVPAYIKDQPAFRTVTYLERFYDLTLPASDEILASDLDDSVKIRARSVGGLDAFLEVIETEIKPRVAAMVPIDSSSQSIFGHSLGGLAVLHALFTAPNAFRTFIAASPSIWWNRKAVLGGESKFADAVRAGTATPRVLITMGSEEQTPDPKYAARFGLDFEQHAAQIRRHRMVDNAREPHREAESLPDQVLSRLRNTPSFPNSITTLQPGRRSRAPFPSHFRDDGAVCAYLGASAEQGCGGSLQRPVARRVNFINPPRTMTIICVRSKPFMHNVTGH